VDAKQRATYTGLARSVAAVEQLLVDQVRECLEERLSDRVTRESEGENVTDGLADLLCG
jgi:hypothetical protein